MKSFELVYYDKAYRTLCLERRFKKLLNSEIKHQKEIILEALTRDEMNNLDDISKTLAAVFWSLKDDEESLILKFKTRTILGKTVEYTITNESQLFELLKQYNEKPIILSYFHDNAETKVVTSSSILFHTIYLMNADAEKIDDILSISARKTGVLTKKDGKHAEQFLKDHLNEGMTISEVIDVYNEMLELEIDGTEELYHFDVDECDFEHLKFCLTRQFPTFYDDEFYMITLTVTTPITDNIEQYFEGFDWHGIGNLKRTNFIDDIRETAVYKELYRSGMKMIDYKVSFEES